MRRHESLRLANHSPRQVPGSRLLMLIPRPHILSLFVRGPGASISMEPTLGSEDGQYRPGAWRGWGAVLLLEKTANALINQ